MDHWYRRPTHEIDFYDGDGYEWEVVGVWHRPDGYYLGTDSGCSCYSPWESYTEEDLTGPLTWYQAKEELRSMAETAYQDDYAKSEVESFIEGMERVD